MVTSAFSIQPLGYAAPMAAYSSQYNPQPKPAPNPGYPPPATAVPHHADLHRYQPGRMYQASPPDIQPQSKSSDKVGEGKYNFEF